MSRRRFADRSEAGRELGRRLQALRGTPDLLVLGLPRGGVPVAFEVARALDAPLDVYMVRKLGLPGHEELAVGAVAADGTVFTSPQLIAWAGLTQAELDRIVASERTILEERDRRYRSGRPPLDVSGRHVVLVDDGLATGSTMRAAVTALQAAHPAAITVAVPVGAAAACAELAATGIEVICAQTPDPFHAVGMFYRDFSQTSDDEVLELLASSRASPAA